MVYDCAACRAKFPRRQQLILHWTTKHFEKHVQYYCPINKCLRRFVSKEAVRKHLRCNRHRTSWRDAEEREAALKTAEPFPQEMVKSRGYSPPGKVPPPVGVVLPSLEKDAPKPHHRLFKSVNPYWRQKGFKTPFGPSEAYDEVRDTPVVASVVTLPDVPEVPEEAAARPDPVRPERTEVTKDKQPERPVEQSEEPERPVQQPEEPERPVEQPEKPGVAVKPARFRFPQDIKQLVRCREIGEKKRKYWDDYLSAINVKIMEEKDKEIEKLKERLNKAEEKNKLVDVFDFLN